jgi:hypothetical protein
VVESPLCDQFGEERSYCRRTPAYITDATGQGFDPHKSPDFNMAAQAVIAKLTPYASEAADKNSSLDRFITARWPNLSTFGYGSRDEAGNPSLPWHMASNEYDAQGNLTKANPLHLYDESIVAAQLVGSQGTEFFTNLPTTQQVFATQLDSPLIASLQGLQGKVSFEHGLVYDKEILVLGIFPIRQRLISYRLRVCKNTRET